MMGKNFVRSSSFQIVELYGDDLPNDYIPNIQQCLPLSHLINDAE